MWDDSRYGHATLWMPDHAQRGQWTERTTSNLRGSSLLLGCVVGALFKSRIRIITPYSVFWGILDAEV